MGMITMPALGGPSFSSPLLLPGLTQVNKNLPRTGDWYCPKCGDLQFMKNESCRRCGTDRPEGQGPAQMVRQGGWICPTCGDVVFAQHKLCRMCQTPKPENPEDRMGTKGPPAGKGNL